MKAKEITALELHKEYLEESKNIHRWETSKIRKELKAFTAGKISEAACRFSVESISDEAEFRFTILRRRHRLAIQNISPLSVVALES